MRLASAATLTSPVYDKIFTRKARRFNELREHHLAEFSSYGIDVLAIGDSLFGTVDPIGSVELRNMYAIVPIIRRILQMELNDPSIKGGMGFVNWTNGGNFAINRVPIANGGDVPTPGTDGDVYSGTTASSMGCGARHLGLAAGKTRYNGIQMLGSASTSRAEKRAVKKVCLVGRKYSGGPTNVAIDISASSWPNRGAGNVATGTWDMSNATTVYGARSQLFTIANELLDNRLAQRGASSGAVAYTDGVILFNGDEAGSCIRVHEHGHPGCRWAAYSEESLKATIDSFTSRDGVPASNGRVAILSSLLNDANEYPSRSLASIRTLIESVIQRCIDRGMKVIYLIPPTPDPTAAFYATSILNDAFMPTRQAIYDMQSSTAFRDHMDIIDLGMLNRFEAYSDSAVQKGIYDDDKVHLGIQAHQMAGYAIAYRIVSGLLGIAA